MVRGFDKLCFGKTGDFSHGRTVLGPGRVIEQVDGFVGVEFFLILHSSTDNSDRRHRKTNSGHC